MEHKLSIQVGEEKKEIVLKEGEVDLMEGMRKEILKAFSLPSSFSSEMKVRYIDEEGDMITISTAIELKEVLSSSPSFPFFVESPQGIPTQEEEEKEKEPEAGHQEQQEEGGGNVSHLEYYMNEFHYHRLIVQTSLQAIFDSLKKNYDEEQKPKVDEFWKSAETTRAQILQSIEKAIEQWRVKVNELPPAQEISNLAAENLRKFGTYAAPLVETIRMSILSALEKLFAKIPSQSITSADLLRELDSFPLPNLPGANDAEGSEKKEEEKEEEKEGKEKEKEEEPKPQEVKQEEKEEEPVVEKKDEKKVQEDSQESVEKVEKEKSDLLVGEFVFVEEFEFAEQLRELVGMGFSEENAKLALLANEGNLEAALNSLL